VVRKGNALTVPEDMSGFDMDKTTFGTAGYELDLPGDLGEQGVILAHAYIHARAETAAALPDENGSAGYGLSVKALNPQALGMAVAPVSRTSDSLFVCHEKSLKKH
jgi:hypothetical protein